MREMAATGDLTRRISVPRDGRWQDEDTRLLATTFNSMTDSISASSVRRRSASGCRRSAACRRWSRTRSATRS